MVTRLSAVIAILLCIPFLNGCSKKEQSSNSDVPAAVSTIITEADTKTIGWGQGTITDAYNRPVSCNQFAKRYGHLDALFGGEDPNDASICLTFDEGYENGCTAEILDILKKKNCPAVFFVTMDYVKREPELVRRMIEEGHIIGNHTTSHPSMPSLSPEEISAEIETLHTTIEQTFHYQMTLLRPPMGEFSEQSLAVTKQLGYTTVFWSFAYKDWLTDAQPNPQDALEKLISAAHPDAIYLLHAVSQTNQEILGTFIDQMRQNGYIFRAIP